MKRNNRCPHCNCYISIRERIFLEDRFYKQCKNCGNKYAYSYKLTFILILFIGAFITIHFSTLYTLFKILLYMLTIVGAEFLKQIFIPIVKK
ncbi:hypothetical protein AN1V17_10720 [Vallitalea sediminicola]